MRHVGDVAEPQGRARAATATNRRGSPHSGRFVCCRIRQYCDSCLCVLLKQRSCQVWEWRCRDCVIEVATQMHKRCSSHWACRISRHHRHMSIVQYEKKSQQVQRRLTRDQVGRFKRLFICWWVLRMQNLGCLISCRNETPTRTPQSIPGRRRRRV